MNKLLGHVWLWERFSRFLSHNHIGKSLDLNRKKCENSKGIHFWLLKTLRTFKDYQDAKFEASRTLHHHKSYDIIFEARAWTCMFIHFVLLSSSVPCK